MDTEIHERLATLEANQATMLTTLTETAGDVRAIRDQVMIDGAARNGAGGAWKRIGIVLIGSATTWAAFHDQIRRLIFG